VTGFEPATLCLASTRSSQLSYTRVYVSNCTTAQTCVNGNPMPGRRTNYWQRRSEIPDRDTTLVVGLLSRQPRHADGTPAPQARPAACAASHATVRRTRKKEWQKVQALRITFTITSARLPALRRYAQSRLRARSAPADPLPATAPASLER
jgi:hypothetical protein